MHCTALGLGFAACTSCCTPATALTCTNSTIATSLPPQRVVLAPHEHPLRPRPAADANAMMQSVLDSLPPPPSPPARFQKQQSPEEEDWVSQDEGEAPHQQRQQQWHQGGGEPAVQQGDGGDGDQVLTWAEQSRLYGMQVRRLPSSFEAVHASPEPLPRSQHALGSHAAQYQAPCWP